MFLGYNANHDSVYTNHDAWTDKIVETVAIDAYTACSRMSMGGLVLWTQTGVKPYWMAYVVSNVTETILHLPRNPPQWLIEAMNLQPSGMDVGIW